MKKNSEWSKLFDIFFYYQCQFGHVRSKMNQNWHNHFRSLYGPLRIFLVRWHYHIYNKSCHFEKILTKIFIYHKFNFSFYFIIKKIDEIWNWNYDRLKFLTIDFQSGNLCDRYNAKKCLKDLIEGIQTYRYRLWKWFLSLLILLAFVCNNRMKDL